MWLNGGVVDPSQYVGEHFTQPLPLTLTVGGWWSG